MTKINTMLTNAIVITMDDEFNIFEPGAVAIRGINGVDVGVTDKRCDVNQKVHLDTQAARRQEACEEAIEDH